MNTILMDIVLFILIFFLFVFAIKNEKKDFYKRNGDCQILKSDTLLTSLDKMDNIIKEQLDFPKWRRSLIISIIISLSLSILLFYRIDMRNILIIFLCSFIIIYSTYNWYDFHYHKRVDENLIKIIKKIRKYINS